MSELENMDKAYFQAVEHIKERNVFLLNQSLLLLSAEVALLFKLDETKFFTAIDILVLKASAVFFGIAVLLFSISVSAIYKNQSLANLRNPGDNKDEYRKVTDGFEWSAKAANFGASAWEIAIFTGVVFAAIVIFKVGL